MSELSGFDWVKARAECSVAKIFNALYIGVREDVRKANEELRSRFFPGHPAPPFDLVTHSDTFGVFGPDDISSTVKFSREKDCIRIEAGSLVYIVTLTVNDAGLCKLRVNAGAEKLDEWQVRKMVLEPLFFGTPAPHNRPAE